MNDKDDNNNNYYLYFEITNINIIKNLFESFGSDIDTVHLIFIKSKNETNIEITCTNSTRTFYFKSCFNTKLIKNLFCESNNIEIEIISTDLLNILKSSEQDDNLLLFYIYNNDKKNMIIKFESVIIEKKKIKKQKKFSLSVGYPIYPEKKISKINFDKKILMDVNKFYKICKDLNSLFKNVKICSKNDKTLYFGYDTNKCEGLIKLIYDKSNIMLENLSNSKNDNITCIYNIEDIIKFSKLINITTSYNFMIKNNYFLQTIYKIGEYGQININFIPLKEDNIKNNISLSNINYDDDYDNSSNISNTKKKIKKTINDKIIYIEIDKIELFKNLCECVEKIVSEPIFIIDTKDNIMKINILCYSNSKNIYLNIELTNIFGRYKKLENHVDLGISLKNFNDILKTVDKNDKIILSIDPHDKHNLTIQIKKKINVENELNLKRIYKIRLLNIEEVKPFDFKNSINLASDISIKSNEFYKICKDINTIGEELKIFYDKKNLIFSTMSECKYANIINKENDIIKIKENKNSNFDKIINEFEIKDIINFNKLSGMMEDFNINLRTDGKLIINSKFIDMSGSMSIQYLSKNINDISQNDKNLIKSDVETTEDKLLFFKLKKITFMKNIIDTLDKMVSDVEWSFSSNTDENNNDMFVGLEIICTDPSKTLYVKTKLTNKLFKSYYCEKKIFKFGMNLEYFNKILRLIEKNDIAIYCYIEKNDPNYLIVRFKNCEKKNKKMFKIPLQIINTKKENIQLSLEFEKKITVKPDVFFSKCKIILNTSPFVKIECHDDKLTLNCVGDKQGFLTLDSIDDSKFEIINLNKNKIIGTYEIKNILLFTRLSSITSEFSFYMKNNYALTLIYNFDEFGSINVMLSPTSEEYINNQLYNYDDEDDEDDIQFINNNCNLIEIY